jgi:hypothetical protein
MHECNAHFCVLSISSLTSWDVTLVDSTMYKIYDMNLTDSFPRLELGGGVSSTFRLHLVGLEPQYTQVSFISLLIIVLP